MEVVGNGAKVGRLPKMPSVYGVSTTGSITTTCSTTPLGSIIVSTTGTSMTGSATGMGSGTATGAGSGMGGGGIGGLDFFVVFFPPFILKAAAPPAAAKQQQKQQTRRVHCQICKYKPQLPEAVEPRLFPEAEESLALEPPSNEPPEFEKSMDLKDAEDPPEPELALESHGVIVVVKVKSGFAVVVYVYVYVCVMQGFPG